MPATTRSVTQTVNALLETYKQEIKAAAGDQVLSRTEAQRLTPFARRHIDEARKPGQSMTVSKAVAALKPVLTRAALAVAGGDGMIDLAEAKQLRVAELRQRTVSLFEGAPTGGRAQLDSALRGVDVSSITDYGRSFELRSFPAGSTERAMISKIVDLSEDDLGTLSDWGTRKSGAGAVSGFAEVIREAGVDFAENHDDGEADQKRLDAVADAVGKYFKPSDFQKIAGYRHTITEDGDMEYNVLLAQKQDGSWTALTHTNFPF